ncbi:nucleotide exchange factor GrpE, partial [Candidatus Azambacteria bacterium]|nr:nucleotide exchange factor GrpE [Candidatus Azambacteria bacterium]
NYKKDQEKAMQAFVKFAARDIIERLLPVLDSFELAIQHVPKELEGNGWAQGVKHTKQQVDAVLKDVGVGEIRALGEKFDPSVHEAVAEEAADGEEGKVIEVLQKGYVLHGEVIRPAKVKISKKKE